MNDILYSLVLPPCSLPAL